MYHSRIGPERRIDLRATPVLNFLNRLTDLIFLNFLWIVFSLPIVTIGASTTAMYYVNITSIREGDGRVFAKFWKSFRMNFRQATIIWLCMLFAIVSLLLDVLFWAVRTDALASVMLTASVAVAVLLAIPGQYIFPVLAKLKGTIRETVRNAVLFSVGYIKYTLICLVISAVWFWLIYTQTAPALVFAMFIGCSLQSFIKSFFYYRAMLNHIDEEYDDLDGESYEEE